MHKPSWGGVKKPNNTVPISKIRIPLLEATVISIMLLSNEIQYFPEAKQNLHVFMSGREIR
jgi:hypothetical protein